MKKLIVLIFLFGTGLAIAGCAANTESDAAIVEGLKGYAALLREVGRNAEASGMDNKAEKLRQTLGNTKSVFLGFNPSKELRDYAVLLRSRDRQAEADEMAALAGRRADTNYQNYLRLMREAN